MVIEMIKLMIYSCIVFFLIIVSLIIIKKHIVKKESKDNILKIFSLVTVALHYSNLWVDYFTTGQAIVSNTMLLPIYPCNICMWLVLIYAFSNNKESYAFKVIGEFLGYVGTVCGVIGLVANEVFLSNPSFLVYHSVQGLFSHTTMIFTTTLILTQGYIKTNTLQLTISTTFGLLLFAIDGLFINLIMKMFELPEVNSMYMLEFPVDIPGINFFTIGLLGVILTFLGGSLYERIFLDKEKRWYNSLNKEKVN